MPPEIPTGQEDQSAFREPDHLAADLAEAQRQFEQLTYRISHDMNGPLASIAGLVSIARNESDPAEVSKYLELIHRSVNRLQSFVGELVEITRIQNFDVHPQAVELAPWLDDVLAPFREWPQAERLQLTTHCELSQAVIDPSWMRTQLQHLIHNSLAYHHRSDGSGWIRLSAQPSEGGLILSVEDNGPGIAPQIQPFVFDMFYRGHRDAKGSGLGLFLVKAGMSKLGGSVTLTSEPERGSCFSLFLPQ